MRASVGPGVWVAVRTNGVGDLLVEACWRREVRYVAAVALNTEHLQNKQIYPTLRLLSDNSGMPTAHFPELLLLPFRTAASPIKSVWSWFHKELSNNKNKNSKKKIENVHTVSPPPSHQWLAASVPLSKCVLRCVSPVCVCPCVCVMAVSS